MKKIIKFIKNIILGIKRNQKLKHLDKILKEMKGW